MIRSRAYSTARSYRGRRLLDYVTPQTHAVVPRQRWLLTTRTGSRYENGVPRFNDRLELATVLALLLRAEPASHTPTKAEQSRAQHDIFKRLGLQGTLAAFKQRYSAGDDVFGEILRREERRPADLERWLRCIRAASLGAALDVIAAQPDEPWPDFVLLHTFGRHARSPLEAYNAVRQFQHLIPGVAPHYRPELTVLLIHMAQKQLVDLVPVVVRVFLEAQKDASPAVCNELLWQIARFATNWSPTDAPLLLDAQELLVQHAGVVHVDAKGLFALAYMTHFQRPHAAMHALNELGAIVANRTPEAQAHEFAYSCGPLAMRILTADTVEDALVAMDEAKHHRPMLWTCVCLYLSRRGLLTRDVAMRILRRVGRDRLRLSGLLAELLIGAVPDLSTKRVVLDTVLREGLRLTPALAANMVKVGSALDLELVLAAEYMAPFLTNPRVLQQVLDTQSRVDPRSAWKTYTQLCNVSLPTRAALRSLCRAAWDQTIVWDGVYAPQRALAEVKAHVRGAVAPSDDLMRVFPDSRMLYNYLIMIGRAGYTEEIVGFLKWMDDLEFKPTKQMLLALVHYSPLGPALLKLGQKAGQPHTEWPTEEEYELYAQQH